MRPFEVLRINNIMIEALWPPSYEWASEEPGKGNTRLNELLSHRCFGISRTVAKL